MHVVMGRRPRVVAQGARCWRIDLTWDGAPLEVRDVPAVSVAIDMLGALQATKVRANANAAADVAKKILRGGRARPSQPAHIPLRHKVTTHVNETLAVHRGN